MEHYSQLCILLNAELIYRMFAEIIFEESINLKFASTMVRTLNTILLTTTELFELRKLLKDITNEVTILKHLIAKLIKILIYHIFHRNRHHYLSVYTCPGLTVPFQLCHCAYWPNVINMFLNWSYCCR